MNSIKKIDYVSVLAALLLFGTFFLDDFIHIKATRISSPEPISAHTLFKEFYWIFLAMCLLMLVLTLIKKKDNRLSIITGLYADIFLALLLVAIPQIYTKVVDLTATARLSFGVGQIIAIAVLYSIILKCEECIKNIGLKAFVSVLGWGLVMLGIVTGLMNSYSVMQEYIAAKPQFFDNVWAHLVLTFWAVIVAVAVGIPLGYLCYKSAPFDKVAVIGMSIVEVIPQLALFAVIRIPFIYLSNQFPALKEMGFGGYGFAPAFTALMLYALYLMMHNSRAAFSNIDPQLVENAYAMGMSSTTVFWKVRIPVALPVILNGIRISIMSSIVGATLSSFVGAASLGMYVVNGINALAIDLQLLGVLPIFFLAVTADLGMSLIIKRLTYVRS